MGREVTVYYQPGNSAFAVLENDIGPGARRHYQFMGVVTGALAIGIMLFGRMVWNTARDGVAF